MKNVLTDLSKMDIYETGNRGTIVITSDGSHLYVRTEKGGNKPSVNGKIISSGKSISMPVLQSIDIVSNKNKNTSSISWNKRCKEYLYKQKCDNKDQCQCQKFYED